MTLKENALQKLRTMRNDPEALFREGQWEAIDGILAGDKRILVIQKTGWGKSAVYFVTTKLLREQGHGPTIIISPLLALMRNQIEAAERMGLKVETINSSNQKDWERIKDDLLNNRLDALIISPERLSSDEFIKDVFEPISAKISFFVVDEAHCISDWGHDFRPDYRRIVRILQLLPKNIRVLGTTATANQRVEADIKTQLGGELIVSRGYLVRDSLRLQNIEMEDDAHKMAWLAEKIPQIKGHGIIYTLTVPDAMVLADWLSSKGIAAKAYYAALGTEAKTELEAQLLGNEIKVLVSTVALGMGFDKPDVSFVIHFQRPKSVIDYYQQVGRAGRALDEAYGILLGAPEDNEIIEHFIQAAFPPQTHVESILKGLRNAPEAGLKMRELEKLINLPSKLIEKTIKYLLLESPSPIRQTVLPGSKARGYSLNPIPYKTDETKIIEITKLRYAENAKMLEYLRWTGCLMQFLAVELGDGNAKPCGRCASCQGKELLSKSISAELLGEAYEFILGRHIDIEARKKWPDAWERKEEGTSISKESLAEDGKALCRWGETGWAKWVKKGKYEDGHFDEKLVDAMMTMVSKWRPNPHPTWVTAVPSKRHAGLVEDFARRFAQKAGLPYHAALVKSRETMPQKEMENSYQQLDNLWEAFQTVDKQVEEGPVFLIDDMVDSRWTFTVCAFLLRKAGSGPVYPLALADTSKGA